jgi:hypothetical protein
MRTALVVVFTATVFGAARVPAAPKSSARGEEAFRAVVSVLQHPRCLNCHIPGDQPLQGDEGRLHGMRVKRGTDGRGTVAMRCGNCHQAENSAVPDAPPGARNWQLPPPATPMIFRGVSPGELCRTLKDPKANGGKSLDQLVEHVRSDKLVLWGFEPGDGRRPPPLDHETFVARFREWVSAGAPCES